MGDAVRAAETGEATLTALIAEGQHRAALRRLAGAHGAALARLCYVLLGDAGEAEEVAQEALLAAHDGFASFRGEGSPRAWLLGIGRRRCARRLAKRSRRQRRLRLVPPAEHAPGPDEALARARAAQRVRAALEALRPTDREALVLRYEGELSYRDMGAALGIDEATARKRASRALGRLKDVLGEKR